MIAAAVAIFVVSMLTSKEKEQQYVKTDYFEKIPGLWNINYSMPNILRTDKINFILSALIILLIFSVWSIWF